MGFFITVASVVVVSCVSEAREVLRIWLNKYLARYHPDVVYFLHRAPMRAWLNTPREWSDWHIVGLRGCGVGRLVGVVETPWFC